MRIKRIEQRKTRKCKKNQENISFLKSKVDIKILSWNLVVFVYWTNCMGIIMWQCARYAMKVSKEIVKRFQISQYNEKYAFNLLYIGGLI